MNIDEFNRIVELESFDFIDSIYLQILKRKPDVSGREAALAALNSGADRRAMVLGMMYSEEARKYAAHFREVQEMLEAERAAKQVSLPGRRYFRRLLSLPIMLLKKLRPRARLLAAARMIFGPSFLASTSANSAVMSAATVRPLNGPIEIPKTISEPAAAIYRQLALHHSFDLDQRS